MATLCMARCVASERHKREKQQWARETDTTGVPQSRWQSCSSKKAHLEYKRGFGDDGHMALVDGSVHAAVQQLEIGEVPDRVQAKVLSCAPLAKRVDVLRCQVALLHPAPCDGFHVVVRAIKNLGHGQPCGGIE